MKRILITRFTAILVLAVFSLGMHAQGIGEPAPDFTLNSSTGEAFTLSDNLGKVVFINFVGYTCGLCIGNAPTINTEVYDKFKSNDNFVAIAIDAWDGDEDGVNYYIENSGVSFPVLAMGSEVAAAYNSGKHRVIVIDSEGIVQHNTNKDATAEEIADAVAALDGLFDITMSTNDSESSLFHIYPNPATEFININTSFTDEEISLKVFNAVGKEVLILNKLSSETIDVSAFAKGVYYLQLNVNSKIATQKLIVN